MPKSTDPVAENSLIALKEGIKNKYREYHVRDKIKFPDFEYNSNRANYQPLKDSFEEEFYVVRGIARVNNTIHIPSTNTLALIYSDSAYVPGKKILNTCKLYIEGEGGHSVISSSSEISQPTFTKNPVKSWSKIGVAILVSLIALSGLAVYTHNLHSTIKPASGLVIDRPSNGETVSRQLLAEGKVSNASTVWIVVRAVKSVRYWVQPEAKVDDMGRWKGQIYIGSEDKADIGIRAQIRAFVNPIKPLKEGEVLYSWPDAQLSSKVIEVTRELETSN